MYRGSDDTWRYAAPGDVFVRISGDDRLLSLLWESEVTGRILDETDQRDVQPLRAALTERGVLTDDSTTSPRESTVHIEGEGALCDHLVEIFGADRCTVGVLDEDTVAAADIVVACGQWLPDQRWQQLDKWCTDHKTPWHRCYAEGTTIVVGPLFIPDRTASYRDTRGRLLAAAPLPDELADFWEYLHSEPRLPPVMLTPATLSVVAGLLAADLVALASGTPVPSEGYQLVADMSSASVTKHRVLPLPNLAVNDT